MSAFKQKMMAIVLTATALVSVERAMAETVVLGTDYLMTASGALDFGGTIGIVNFTGNPIGPGNADTIIQRTSDITINATNSYANLQITALSLVSKNIPVPIYVTLDPAMLSGDTGTMNISGSVAGGTFSSFFDIFFDICTAPAANGVGCGSGTLLHTGKLSLSTSGTTWGPTAPGNAVIVSGLVGDQAANLHGGLSGLQSDFWPGLITIDTWPVQVATTPLPTALPLLVTGLGALGLLGWRRKRKASAETAL